MIKYPLYDYSAKVTMLPSSLFLTCMFSLRSVASLSSGAAILKTSSTARTPKSLRAV